MTYRWKDILLPNMPYKQLPKARYPYSSVIFSMWGYNGGSNEHYGALEVVEGDDLNIFTVKVLVMVIY